MAGLGEAQQFLEHSQRAALGTQGGLWGTVVELSFTFCASFSLFGFPVSALTAHIDLAQGHPGQPEGSK